MKFPPIKAKTKNKEQIKPNRVWDKNKILGNKMH